MSIVIVIVLICFVVLISTLLLCSAAKASSREWPHEPSKDYRHYFRVEPDADANNFAATNAKTADKIAASLRVPPAAKLSEAEHNKFPNGRW